MFPQQRIYAQGWRHISKRNVFTSPHRRQLGQQSHFRSGSCEERTWTSEAEWSPLLEAVAKERLVKTKQAGKGLAGTVVICELWRLAVGLQLRVLADHVYKLSITSYTNQNPVYSHSYTWIYWTEKNLGGSGIGLIEVILWQLLGGTYKNTKKSLLG
jgi:hypothetical protein